MPSEPPSRPKPDSLMPPNGAAGVGDHAAVDADHAGLDGLGHPQRAVQRRGVDVGGQPVLGVVGRRDALLLGVEAGDRRDGPEHLLLEDARVGRDVGQHGRRIEDAPARPVRHRRRRRSRRVPPRRKPGPATVATCLALISGPSVDESSSPLPRVNSLIRLTSFSVNSSRTAFATWNRLAAVQASPPLRILARIAPSTAASTSASSNTMNGALPPSSIDSRSSLSAPAWPAPCPPRSIR